MTAKEVKNLPASIHQRLLNRAKQENRPLQELLQYFAIERFLYRLSLSNYAEKFVLKGALMLRIWDSPLARPTLDVDFLGRMAAQEQALILAMRDILGQNAPEDGVAFDTTALRAESIRAEARYQGFRVHFTAHIGNMKVPMQVDVAYGDAVTPGPAWIDFPVLLDFPSPHLLVYPHETALAEKFQALVMLDVANSRMKDFYDLWTLARKQAFDGVVLQKAIETTFQRRNTRLPSEPPTGLTVAFAEDRVKQVQWAAFLRKGRFDPEGKSFADIIAFLEQFLMPPTLAAAKGKEFPASWPAGSPWQPKVAPPSRS